MAKDSILHIRIDTDLKAAVMKAAEADERSLSWLVGKILSDWLAAQPKKRTPGRQPIPAPRARRKKSDGE